MFVGQSLSEGETRFTEANLAVKPAAGKSYICRKRGRSMFEASFGGRRLVVETLLACILMKAFIDVCRHRHNLGQRCLKHLAAWLGKRS